MKNGKKFLLSLAITLVPTIGAAAEKTFTVGIALRFNDAYNNSVKTLKNGVETAKIMFEKEHPDVKIQLKILPHGADLISVNAVADKIIAEKIPAVIGGEMSEESIVFGDRLGPQKIVFFTPTSSSPKVTEDKPYVFRACFSDRTVATEMARYMREVAKPIGVGIIHNVSSQYSDYLSTRFTETFNRMISHLGPQDRPGVFVQKVLRRNLDFSKQIKLFMENKVSHVVMFTHDADLIQFVVQAEEKKFFPTYVGSDGWGSNQYIFNKFITESKTGAKFVGVRNYYWREDLENKISKQFRANYKKQHGNDGDAWSAIAFDTAWVLFNAMAKSKDPTNGEDIKNELKKTEGMQLVTTNSFSFAEDNSPKKDLYLYRISKTGIQYETTLK